MVKYTLLEEEGHVLLAFYFQNLKLCLVCGDADHKSPREHFLNACGVGGTI